MYTHHERRDGTGYPQGLRATDIPVAGRVMTLRGARARRLASMNVHLDPGPARPRNTRTARLTRTMSSSERRPTRISTLLFETVVILSIIN